MEQTKFKKEFYIEAVARESKKWGGIFSRGFKSDDKWYNVNADTEEAVNKLFTEDLLSKGNVIKCVIGEKNTATEIELIEKGEPLVKNIDAKPKTNGSPSVSKPYLVMKLATEIFSNTPTITTKDDETRTEIEMKRWESCVMKVTEVWDKLEEK